MVLYSCIIVFAMILIDIFNGLFALSSLGITMWTLIFWTILGVVLSIILDGIAVLAVRLMSKRINIDSVFFKERKGERRFYDMLSIRKWKDLIPEMGKTLKYFDKTTVAKEVNSAYFEMFILETCLAEFMHIFSIILAPLLLVIMPLQFILRISLPIVIVNISLNIPPILVQRYNRPKLRMAYARQLRKESQQLDNGELNNEKI